MSILMPLMPIISLKSLQKYHLQKVTIPLLSMLFLLLTGCQESPSEQSRDKLSELSLMHETIQVVSDIPVDAQKVLAEVYVHEAGVHIEWLGLEALGDINITARIDDNILIEPEDMQNSNGNESITAEQALLEGVPLPRVGDESDDSMTHQEEQSAQQGQSVNDSSMNASVNGSTDATNNTNNTLAPEINNQAPTSAVIKDYNTHDDTLLDEQRLNAQGSIGIENHISSIAGNYKIPEKLDVLLLHSVYDIQEIAQHNQLQPIASDLLIQRIPSYYQDPNGQWFGLSHYGRALVYHQKRVNANTLINYSQLAEPQWEGRLCMTPYYLPDNQATLQTIQTHRGANKARQVLTGWVQNDTNIATISNSDEQQNISLNPSLVSMLKSDNDVLEAIAAEDCDVGMVNSDAFMQYAASQPETDVRLVWSNQSNYGTVTNTVTAGIAKYSDDASKALEFIEWLSSDRGQAILSFYTQTFPVVDYISDPSIDMLAVRPAWTEFNVDTTPLADMFKGVKNSDSASRTD